MRTWFSFIWPGDERQSRPGDHPRVDFRTAADHLRGFRQLKTAHLAQTKFVAFEKDGHVLVVVASLSALAHDHVVGQDVGQVINLFLQSLPACR